MLNVKLTLKDYNTNKVETIDYKDFSFFGYYAYKGYTVIGLTGIDNITDLFDIVDLCDGTLDKIVYVLDLIDNSPYTVWGQSCFMELYNDYIAAITDFDTLITALCPVNGSIDQNICDYYDLAVDYMDREDVPETVQDFVKHDELGEYILDNDYYDVYADLSDNGLVTADYFDKPETYKPICTWLNDIENRYNYGVYVIYEQYTENLVSCVVSIVPEEPQAVKITNVKPNCRYEKMLLSELFADRKKFECIDNSNYTSDSYMIELLECFIKDFINYEQ